MQLCVALDLPTKEENLKLLESIKEHNIWVKVGFRTYIRDSKDFIQNIKKINPEFKIFLDLKLYDIPNTMADAAEEIANIGVDMFNVHASSGVEAMKRVMSRLSKFDKPPLVLAVTALTSFDNDSFENIYGKDIKSKAKEFAIMSFEAGLNGVVCSAHESLDIKNATSRDFLTLTPGIRPFGEDSNDQKRVATIESAKESDVDIIVVGRPIYKNENPAKKVEEILEAL